VARTCPASWAADDWTSDRELTCRVLNVTINIVSVWIGNLTGGSETLSSGCGMPVGAVVGSRRHEL